MICSCCHEDKPTKHFTYSSGFGWAKHCRVCGVWLRLLRPYFGPTRDWEANRKKVAERKRVLKVAQPPKVKKPKPPKVKAPKPIKERATYVYAYRTILANAPWPYRRTAGVSGVSV